MENSLYADIHLLIKLHTCTYKQCTLYKQIQIKCVNIVHKTYFTHSILISQLVLEIVCYLFFPESPCLIPHTITSHILLKS